MKIAVSSLGTSLDAWTGTFRGCPQFLVVDTENMEFIVIAAPAGQPDTPQQANLAAIRALARQEVNVILTGEISDLCRQTMLGLGMEVIDSLPRMTVRETVERYLLQGAAAVTQYVPPPARVAVASHGDDLDATLGPKGSPCTSFVLVDPGTMDFEIVRVAAGSSPEETSVNAVRAAARSGATTVITAEIRPACCIALRALAITVLIAEPGMTVREAVAAYQRDELPASPYQAF